MAAARRGQVLQALGIEQWSLRSAAPAVVEPELPASPPARERPPLPSAPASRAEMPSRPAAPPPVVVAAPLAPVEVPQDWTGLREMVKDCRRCKLCTTRTQTVFGVGVETAPLMVVGEGPGADEDAQGEPFVGKAGKLLDEMLRAIGRSRCDNTFIANVVKCRPPGNRDPETDEVEACRPYLEQQIRLVKPKLIVGLGRIAAQRLLGTDAPLSRLRGPLHEYGPDKTPLLITYHPAYLLRSPREKAKSWEDLKKIHQFLKGA
ncbi:MAG TPA: uracil-DNA glycosylase [Solimonas sp.]|nr:uracil-DNA glycosylase [Solimonas sp.]